MPPLGRKRGLYATTSGSTEGHGPCALVDYAIYSCTTLKIAVLRRRLDEGATFVPGAPTKMKGANYYPTDITVDEFEAFVKQNPQLEPQARGFFHVLRRGPANALQVVSYSEEYKELLRKASFHLHQAANTCTNASMSRFLRGRADSFLSNEYFDSDVAWMEIDDKSALDATIGPYEVYRDEQFNYKASFESFLGLRDFEETQKLSRFSDALQDVEDHLPIAAEYRNPSLGSLSPIVVINLLFAAGDVGGPQTAAFNLPNDEKVVELKGSKRTMLKNVQEQKFEKILIPIADLVIAKSQRHLVSFNAFFTHILAHELMHGLGPHKVSKSEGQQTVRQAMQELHSALEEAKADITGLLALEHFISRGIVPKEQEETFYVTFLASAFRSIRFGLEEAHGKGQAVQLTYLIECGAFAFDQRTQTFSVDFAKAKQGVVDLSREIMTIQAEGDKDRASKLMSRYGILTLEVQQLLRDIEAKNVPVDIFPQYGTALELLQ